MPSGWVWVGDYCVVNSVITPGQIHVGPDISTKYRENGQKQGYPLFFETFFNCTEIFFHRVLILLREPCAGVEGSILYLRMRVGPAPEASQKKYFGAVEFNGEGV